MKFPIVILMIGMCAWGQDKPKPAQFTHCSVNGGTGNADGYTTMSEIYHCDQGDIELHGEWQETIERGFVYETRMGRPEGDPYRITVSHLKTFDWCYRSRTSPYLSDHWQLCRDDEPKKKLTLEQMNRIINGDVVVPRSLSFR
jgi:hypothetical protein